MTDFATKSAGAFARAFTYLAPAAMAIAGTVDAHVKTRVPTAHMGADNAQGYRTRGPIPV